MTIVDSNRTLIHAIATHIRLAEESAIDARHAIDPLIVELIKTNPEMSLKELAILASVPIAKVKQLNREFCGRRKGAASPSHPFHQAIRRQE
jgi:hypothetical protein